MIFGLFVWLFFLDFCRAVLTILQGSINHVCGCFLVLCTGLTLCQIIDICPSFFGGESEEKLEALLLCFLA